MTFCYHNWLNFIWLILFPVIVTAQNKGDMREINDWNRLHTLSPGIITRVQIDKNEAPKGERKIRGFFSSYTDTSITLLFPTGQTRTIEKRLVSTVRIRRPFKKRYTGWGIGISVAIITGILYTGPGTGDIEALGKLLIPSAITAPSMVAGFFMMPTKLVYRSPLTP